jgi:hypothetical protein
MMRPVLQYIVCWCAAVVFVLGGCTSKAIVPMVRSSVDKRQVQVLEPFHYSLRVCLPPHAQVEFPDFTKAFGSCSVKETKESVRIWWGKQYSDRQFVLEAPVAQDVEIPSLVVRYRFSETAEWQDLTTQSHTVMVKSMLPADAALLDIRDIKPLPGRSLAGAFIICLLACIGGVLFWLFRRKKNIHALSQPAEPAHVRAFGKLEILQNEELLRKGRPKEYFSRLGDIVREYIELRFFIRAQELTTEEFLSFVRDKTQVLAGAQVVLLTEFLQTCDMVKFARYQPQQQEADAAYAAARRFIEETKEESVQRSV